MLPSQPFLIALAACLAALGCVAAWRLLRNVARTQTRGTFAALAALAIVCAIFADKPTPTPTASVSYPYTDVEQRYIYDNGSYVSNDVVHIAFYYQIAPSTADFQLYAWPLASTNEEEIVLVVNSTLGAVPQPYVFEYQGASSNRWIGITTWTPGPTVHTNGVAVINWQLPYDPAATNIAAMTRTGIYLDGIRLAPSPAITNNTEGITQ